MENGKNEQIWDQEQDFQYPVEVCTSKKAKQTLSVESYLFVAKTADKQSPLKTFGKPFSRYKFSIVEKGKPKEEKSVYANITVSEIEDIIWKTDFAYKKYMSEVMFAPPIPQSQDTAGTGKSACYTVVIKSGNLKDKTPASALAESPSNRKLLLQQYKYLEERLDQYPRNQEQMDAIKEAITLYDRGKLDIDEASSTASSVGRGAIRLYPAETDSIPKPLKRKKRGDGKVFVYEITIEWQMDKRSPVVITIKNYYAIVKEEDDGRLNPDRSTQDALLTKTFYMSASEWVDHLRAIRDDMTIFEFLHAKETRNDAITTYNRNRTKDE